MTQLLVYGSNWKKPGSQGYNLILSQNKITQDIPPHIWKAYDIYVSELKIKV